MIISSTDAVSHGMFLIMSLGHLFKKDAHQLKKHQKFPNVLVSRIPYNHHQPTPTIICQLSQMFDA